jgi:hypothetical protein
VVKIEPRVQDLDWLPVPLRIKHDHNPQHETEFILNPGVPQPIDLVVARIGDNHFALLHSIKQINRSIPAGEYKITVVASGENVPPFSRVFRISIDSHSELQCIPEPNEEQDSVK